ncbi:hypothetical protein JB92DRAFT_3092133 [Gautieria morchelliformis]|nr:hypothetical protein JB92DRAFT_3092133 [Gautieria morchelliformis]
MYLGPMSGSESHFAIVNEFSTFDPSTMDSESRYLRPKLKPLASRAILNSRQPTGAWLLGHLWPPKVLRGIRFKLLKHCSILISPDLAKYKKYLSASNAGQYNGTPDAIGTDIHQFQTKSAALAASSDPVTPLWFRLGCTSVVQHLGGIHSACATSGLLWLIYKVTQTFIDHSSNPAPILVIGVITNLFISIVAVSAIPWIRNNFHNVFERHHRFAGWLGLMFTWVFVMITDSFDTELQKWDLTASCVVRDQQFWFCIGMTACILFPWFTVRKVPVDIELPSPKVAILRFERGMQHGLLSCMSRSAIMEYHAFGIISEGKHAKYHYLICGVQGDFTKSLVNDPAAEISWRFKYVSTLHAWVLAQLCQRASKAQIGDK